VRFVTIVWMDGNWMIVLRVRFVKKNQEFADATGGLKSTQIELVKGDLVMSVT
jgi:hypothetical protein